MTHSDSVGRNAPCPCGSGKKFKRCCGQGSTAKTAASPSPQLLVDQAWQLFQAGNYELAATICRRILEQSPRQPDALHFLGLIAHKQQDHRTAEQYLRQAVERAPGNPGIRCSLGNILRANGDLEGSAQQLREALRRSPDLPPAHLNLGITLKEQGRYQEAAKSYRRALQLNPRLAVAHYDLAICLTEMNLTEQANTHYTEACRLDPGFAESRYNLALQQLAEGNFADGWENYEWRWRCAEFQQERRSFSQPLWDGATFTGKTLLLHAEQGAGDTLQFIRYLPEVVRLGGQVLVECQAELTALLQASYPNLTFIERGAPLPSFDLHCPLLSLPRVFGTDLSSIPAPVPYLRPAPLDGETEAAPLQAPPGAIRVGLVWAGNPKHLRDHKRSLSLSQLAPLFDLPGIHWVSLQKGPASEQLAASSAPIEDRSPQLHTFNDTARLIQGLDLVISVDTAVAHLAGALGKPVWTLTYDPPEWRWLQEREDSPWYPSMRLFRQRSGETWEPAIRQLAESLRSQPPRPAHTDPLPGDTQHSGSEAVAQPFSLPGFNELSKCRHGVMLYNRHDRYVGRSLKNYGEFSEQEASLLTQLVGEGDTLVEVGANIGALTLPLARKVGREGLVYAFEPQRLVFQTLCGNLALNGLTNVDSRQQAVGETRGTALIPPVNPFKAFNFGGVSIASTGDSGEPVAVETLDQLNLRRCRLIKIDVEGMEHAVLAGARQTIQRLQPVLYVENDREEHSAALIRQIQAFGYRLWWHLPPLFNPDNYRGVRENLFGPVVSVNLLCGPPGFQPPLALAAVTGPDDSWQRLLD